MGAGPFLEAPGLDGVDTQFRWEVKFCGFHELNATIIIAAIATGSI